MIIIKWLKADKGNIVSSKSTIDCMSFHSKMKENVQFRILNRNPEKNLRAFCHFQ